MSINNKPATPLPWSIYEQNNTLQIGLSTGLPGTNPCIVHWSGFDGNDLPYKHSAKNAAYIANAANAYPKMVEALRTALEGLEDYGPNVDSVRNSVLSTLRELGEE